MKLPAGVALIPYSWPRAVQFVGCMGIGLRPVESRKGLAVGSEDMSAGGWSFAGNRNPTHTNSVTGKSAEWLTGRRVENQGVGNSNRR